MNNKNIWIIGIGLLAIVIVAGVVYKIVPNHMSNFNANELYFGDTLLAAQAIQQNNFKELREIVINKPNVLSDHGSQDLPLLAWAMGLENPKAVEILLSAGASPDDYFVIEKVKKMSILSLATGAEKSDFFDLLLSYGANPNGVPDTEPPLITAANAEKDDRLKRLLEAGADVNASLPTGKNVLMVLVLINNYETALDLVKNHGADTTVELQNGINISSIIQKYPLPVDTAQGRAQKELMSLLTK